MATPQTQLDPQKQAELNALFGAGDSTKRAVGGFAFDSNNQIDTGLKTQVRKDEFQNFMGPVGPSAMQEVNKTVPVQYWEGDQWQPASLPPQEIMKLQLQLKDAGVIPKSSKYTAGVWDAVSAAALERVMTYANASGRSKEDIIADFAKATTQDEDRTGAVLQVKSPEEIDAVLKDSAAKVIGRSLSPAELSMLRAGYQQLDRTAQEQEAAARAIASEGGTATVTGAPSVDTYANEQLRQKFKGEADYQTGLARMKEFYSMLGEGGGQL